MTNPNKTTSSSATSSDFDKANELRAAAEKLVQEAIDFATSEDAQRKQQQERQEREQLNRWKRQDSIWMFCLYAVAIACVVILMAPSSN